MKYFSMFSGIGGFELGIQRAIDNRQEANNERGSSQDIPSGVSDTERIDVERPVSCIGYSEIDKYAIKVYERHFNHDNYGDATTINASELPDFDLLVGGFPCQAFSVAGKRKGFNDTRGTLFFDIARILAEKRPRHLLLENVKGLLSHDKGKTFQTILGVLSDLGYRVEWQVLNSKDFGVPQNRERIYIVGHLRGECSGKVFPLTGGNTKDNVRRREAEGQARGINNPSRGYEARRDNLASTLKAGESGHKNIIQLNQPTHSNDRVYGTDGVSPTLNTMQGGNRQPFIKSEGGEDIEWGQPFGKSFEGKVGTRIRRLTPKECERLQGFPETEESAIIEVCKQVSANGATKTSSTNDTDQDNAVQNSVLISCEENAVEIHSQGKLLWSANTATNLNSSALPMPIGDFALAVAGIVRIVAKITQDGRAESAPNDKSLTVQVNGKNSVKIYGLEMTQLAKDVRSDTTTVKSSTKSITSNPLDLESTDSNLQILFSYVMTAISGYIPEAIYTDSTSTIQFKSKIGWTAGESDTQRYKMCGNAVTVNVIEAIFRNFKCLENPS